MRIHFSRIVLRVRRTTDASKLCYAAAAGFAVIAGGAIVLNQLTGVGARLQGLAWLSGFYVLLGLLAGGAPAARVTGDREGIADGLSGRHERDGSVAKAA